ncbi:malto-oligosyltrehalose synthase [Streptacidiphilus sp. PB12-B1b]|uniref:malto-oligosyltrehalose synthase n=1 Tax=Streptacidiphilus sp. PB12-B1b TaxID=2705012 RepID=UPI0015F846AA|nr:malto-oligosyltrehalose synthase [Streptacidiphilus sp. PB12-B1b]QMU75968.1 malto-oligosyltrehalose synthase [Streptacidiphilus sp. PB12-B1b]
MTAAPENTPTATYRLQLQPGFGFAEAASAVPYLARLGVSHLHLSPVLEAVPGSTHGYDVVDHGRISEQLGGEPGLRALAATARAHGLGLIVDTVPNHMAAPVPAHLNRAWWELLREGPQSPYARWFDIDWAAQDGRVLLPVLGGRLEEELPKLRVEAEGQPDAAPVLRYFDHAFPLRPGTEALPLPELLEQQWYRLAWWRQARTELNYRRFFTVADLVGVRVEDEEVFAATHRLLLRLYAEGVLQGFRVDHPDGLADPRGYLRRLAEATGGGYVVVEKILTGDEELPEDWACAGTTGYDALRRVDAVLTDRAGAQAVARVYADHLGEDDPGADASARQGRSDMVGPQGELAAEVNRLDRVAADTPTPLPRADIAATLAAYPVYRPYPVPGEPDRPEDAKRLASAAASPEVLELALGRRGRGPAQDEFRVRLAQTASAVAAKGVEDTAFYRRYPLLSLNEVGGDPARPGLDPAGFHAYCARMQQQWPATMTVLSTHDTKRSADARARLAVLAEVPELWRAELADWTALAAATAPDGAPALDPHTGYLLWQTALAAWPVDGDRLAAAVLKSVREAKLRTTWTEPDTDYEQAVERAARAVPATPALAARISALVERLAPCERVNTLSGTLLHLTMPGVPDLYQGSEFPLHTLVDPDNRRIVRFGATPAPGTLAAEKLHLTRVALGLRRALPFDGYTPLPADEHLVAYARGEDVVAVATRLPHRLEQRGGWQERTLELPEGSWTDALTGRAGLTGSAALSELLADLPVALLVRDRPHA